MSSIYGEKLRLSLFGQSHGPAVGMTLDGVPAGLPVDRNALQAFLDRRAPGRSYLTSPRQETDIPEFLAGLVNGHTCGAPITAMIQNRDIRSRDYGELQDCPRPGHADYTAQIKYRGYQDTAGGGHFSGRLTAPVCIAGGMCLQWLALRGISVRARLLSVGNCSDPDGFETEIARAKADRDSVGGIIECIAENVPAGIGDPIFDGMEGRIAQIIFGIPGVKGLEFGSGFVGSRSRGSANNDCFTFDGENVRIKSNHSGGILGGITNGNPIVFRVAVKPTPSIGLPQDSISFANRLPRTLELDGRHDPCIALRAVPVVEAAAAVAIFDAILCQ